MYGEKKPSWWWIKWVFPPVHYTRLVSRKDKCRPRGAEPSVGLFRPAAMTDFFSGPSGCLDLGKLE